MVWDFRANVQHVWPTPNEYDSLLFAVTELGEAIDAHLRKKHYARNNERNMDLHEELADCAIMLVTALGDYDDEPIQDASYLPAISYWISSALFAYPQEVWQRKAFLALCMIANYPGMDIINRVEERLERIYERHVA